MTIFRRAALCALATMSCFSGRAFCASTFDVAPGYDLFQTDASQTTFPGLGNLTGVPEGSYNFGGAIGVQNTGLTDTIIQRTAALTPGSPTSALVMQALQLETVAPVSFGGGPLGEYFVTLQSVHGGPASTGSITVGWDGTGLAGTFSSSIDVFFDIRFGALNGPIVFSSDLPLSQTGAAWNHLPPPGVVQIPGANIFLSGLLGDQTQDFWPGPLIEQHPSGAQHAVTPAQVPEPASVGMMAIALIGLLLIRQRRNRSEMLLH
jgi:hypothetical protein